MLRDEVGFCGGRGLHDDRRGRGGLFGMPARRLGAQALSGFRNAALRQRRLRISAGLSMPVATTETLTMPSRLSSNVAPRIMLASSSTSWRIRLAASSTS